MTAEPKPQRVIRHACNKKTCPGCATCASSLTPCRLCPAPDAGPCRRCGGTLVAVTEGATTFLLHRDRACPKAAAR